MKKRWFNRRIYEYFAVTIAPLLKWSDPILIYQMGKVGSSSIRNSLFRSQDSRTRLVLMSHEYFPVRNRDPDSIAIEPEYREMLKREIEHEQRVYQGFGPRKRLGWRFREKFYAERIYKTWVCSQHPLHVITMVRDPVANNISMFFQLLDQYIDNYTDPANYDIESLISIFLDNYMHSRPLTWLDFEFKTIFGIDIYKKPFPVYQGYTVITRGRTHLLILRCELDDQAKAQAISNFLGIKELEIKRSNIASEKEYAQQYADFKQQINVPPALLDEMYNSKYARHFYSIEERNQFRARWSGNCVSI